MCVACRQALQQAECSTYGAVARMMLHASRPGPGTALVHGCGWAPLSIVYRTQQEFMSRSIGCTGHAAKVQAGTPVQRQVPLCGCWACPAKPPRGIAKVAGRGPPGP
eukprot:353886-Chlamydomonas_euryale.AAC.4